MAAPRNPARDKGSKRLFPQIETAGADIGAAGSAQLLSAGRVLELIAVTHSHLCIEVRSGIGFDIYPIWMPAYNPEVGHSYRDLDSPLQWHLSHFSPGCTGSRLRPFVSSKVGFG